MSKRNNGPYSNRYKQAILFDPSDLADIAFIARLKEAADHLGNRGGYAWPRELELWKKIALSLDHLLLIYERAERDSHG